MREYFAAKVYDAHGHVTGGFDRQPARSFVKNFYNRYCFLMLGVTPSEINDLDLRDTNGAVYTGWLRLSSEDYWWRGNEFVRTDAGILVGSGDTAEDFGMGSVPEETSYALDTIIANGSGPGELERASTEAPVISVSGTGPYTWSAVWTRFFNNNSGASVTVRETGVYIWVSINNRIMVTRSVLASPLLIYDTGQLKVEYTLELEIPG
jgi:hypothetical protein